VPLCDELAEPVRALLMRAFDQPRKRSCVLDLVYLAEHDLLSLRLGLWYLLHACNVSPTLIAGLQACFSNPRF